MTRIRLMTEADIPAVAEVRVSGWQFAYQDLVPRSYLDRMDPDTDAERLRARLEYPDPRVEDVVAEDEDGTVVGWSCVGPYRLDETDGGAFDDDGELFAIYLRPASIGRGVGRTLIVDAIRRATAQGFPALRVWVLEGNARARRFYERAGFAPDGGREPFTVDGVAVPEVRYMLRLAGQETA
ncbi:GNAT family N-acetyltransferase [Streptomyces sp. SL13]|jgi:L-amino acid N-acyltransferase YncA|uniref:GNAT family N-acetyltransferase n=1 Tax=Streptantibioticus silvisoli TaxID=2705255 RepID=A0AA90H518_9ACTN|nr:GNAT family N-acetyltransferase [Streptantibioticus silvisoli]MDI5967184.1 GNAT family N-acetyltransferase [Streptantibioticus silvisoli]MDI5974238.1 GNAT family N-acetyltransferase [Streptantibioticus silvisoli]